MKAQIEDAYAKKLQIESVTYDDSSAESEAEQNIEQDEFTATIKTFEKVFSSQQFDQSYCILQKFSFLNISETFYV